ncbi:MAG: Asp23/Gls24 family envelope stress response protein [Nocardioidaceae bacterium]|nr:Asp23/Gls24 family envelope stress response protein [Nocardioidaceae bacterium]
MTSTTPSTSQPSSKESSSSSSGSGNALVTTQGRTSIADSVVAKIAGIATRDVAGVHALGGGAARAVGAIRERIPGSRTNQAQGVSVEVGERQAAVDVELIADYGVSIVDLADGIRRNVIGSVERMTGLEVTEVNVAVADVYLPTEDNEETEDPQPPRVQ